MVGCVLIPGAKAPKLVTEEMVKTMRPGSVLVDVAIDQGGSIATIDRITTHQDPFFVKHGVLHYSVANMPGAVPRTSTLALTGATLPYAPQNRQAGRRGSLQGRPRPHEGPEHLQRSPHLPRRGRGPEPDLHRSRNPSVSAGGCNLPRTSDPGPHGLRILCPA